MREVENVFSDLTQRKNILENICPDSNFYENCQIEIKFISSSSETHNGGKKPVLITLKNASGETKEFVYKPRNSQIDLSVIQLFNEINESQENQRFALPTYKIYSSENWSVWEKIEGKNARDWGCADKTPILEFIQKIDTLPLEKKQTLIEKIKKMACALAMLDISDLHSENIMLVNVKVNDNGDIIDIKDIVPIDLEVRLRKYITLLTKNIDNAEFKDIEAAREEELSYNLTEQEKALVNKYKTFLDATCTHRALFIGTERLKSALYNCDNLVDLIEDLLDQFKFQGYTITIDDEHFQNLVLRNVLSVDIPFFTEKENVLYYGSILADAYKIGEYKKR